MSDTTYIDGQLPTVKAAWLNDVNLLTYHLVGDGVNAPPTRAQLITNLGLISAASIAATYLTQANAASTYLTQANAAATYLTQANAASTYATIASLSNYLLITTAAATYAPLASPSLSGIPTAPTAAPGTNTTQLATTAFVQTAIGAGSGIGIGQTWQDLTTSRFSGTEYSNTTGRPIEVSVRVNPNPSGSISGPAGYVSTTSGGTYVFASGDNSGGAGGVGAGCTFIVPNGQFYKVFFSGSIASINWSELR